MIPHFKTKYGGERCDHMQTGMDSKQSVQTIYQLRTSCTACTGYERNECPTCPTESAVQRVVLDIQRRRVELARNCRGSLRGPLSFWNHGRAGDLDGVTTDPEVRSEKAEFLMAHAIAKEIVLRLGYHGLLEILQFRFPHLGLYTMSSDWFDDHRYRCEVQGTNGDLHVSWFHINQVETAYRDHMVSLSRAGEILEMARILQPYEFLRLFMQTTDHFEGGFEMEEVAVTKIATPAEARMTLEREYFKGSTPTEPIPLLDRVEELLKEMWTAGYRMAEMAGEEPWKNSACLGYAILGAKALGYTDDQIKALTRSMHSQFDRTSVPEATGIYNQSPF